MKAYAISQLSAKMAELQAQWSEVIDSYNSSVQEAYNNADEAEAIRLESHALRKVAPINKQMNQISAGISTIDKVFSGLQTTLSGYEANFTGVNFNAGKVGSGSSGSKKGSSGSKGSSSSTQKTVNDVQLTIDRYYEYNDVLDDCNALLSQNRELQKYANSVDKQKLLSEEIDLMRKKKELLSDLLDEQNREKQELQSYLRQYGFQIDSMGNIINLQEKLTSLQSWANSSDISAKERNIELVKQLEKATESYTNLCNSEIPKTIQEWQQLNSAIKDSAEDMLTDIRDRLVDALRKKREEEKSTKEKILDERIEQLQKELKALDDEEADKRKKLIKLKNELELWKQDDSPYAKKKIQELQETIAQLEKEIRKDELQQQIDLAEKTKEELQESYEEQLSDKALYGEADKLLTQKNMDEIVDLIQSYDETFKDLGSLLGENLAETIKLEVQNAIKALDILKKEINSLSKPSASNVNVSSGSSSNTSKPSTSNTNKQTTTVKPVAKGSRVRVSNLSAPIYYTSTSGNNSGTWSGTGIVNSNTPLYVVNEANGRVALSKNTSVYSAIGWIDKKYVAGFRIGGSVGKWAGNDGKIIQVHSGEGVLTAEQNKAWLNLVDILPNLSNVFSNAIKNFSIKESENNNKGGEVTVHNNFKVTNNTPFDEERFGNNIETLFKNQLRKFGKIR